MQQEFPLHAPVLRIDQRERLGRVPRVNIVRRRLIMPLQLARIGIQRQDAIGEQVVAAAVTIVGNREREWR